MPGMQSTAVSLSVMLDCVAAVLPCHHSCPRCTHISSGQELLSSTSLFHLYKYIYMYKMEAIKLIKSHQDEITDLLINKLGGDILMFSKLVLALAKVSFRGEVKLHIIYFKNCFSKSQLNHWVKQVI